MKPEQLLYIQNLRFLKNKQQVLDIGRKIHLAHRALIDELEKKEISYSLEESWKYLTIFLPSWKIHTTKLIDYWINSASVDSIFEDKFSTNNILKQANLPVPKEISFEKDIAWNCSKSFSQIKNFCYQIGYPLIMKPNNWQRWRWIHVIYNEEILKKHFENFLAWEYKKDFAILQQFIKWKEIRVIYLAWKILVAYQKQPLKIIWDWEKTISQLIEEKQDITPNLLSQALKGLKDKWIKSNYILEDQKSLQVFDFINPACELDKEIKFSQQDEEFVKKIADAFWSDYFWLDLITNWDIKDWIILEINPKPAIFRAAKISPGFKKNFWKQICEYIIKSR